MIKTISKEDIKSKFLPFYVVDKFILKINLKIGESYNLDNPTKYIDSALSHRIKESFDPSKQNSQQYFYFDTIHDAKQFIYDEIAQFLQKSLKSIGSNHKHEDFFRNALHYLEHKVDLNHPSFTIEYIQDEIKFDLEKVNFYDENQPFFYVFFDKTGTINVTPIYFKLIGFFIVDNELLEMHDQGLLTNSVNCPLYEMVTKDGSSTMIDVPRRSFVNTNKPFSFHNMHFRDLIYPNAEDVVAILEEKKSSLYDALQQYDDMKDLVLSLK